MLKQKICFQNNSNQTASKSDPTDKRVPLDLPIESPPLMSPNQTQSRSSDFFLFRIPYNRNYLNPNILSNQLLFLIRRLTHISLSRDPLDYIQTPPCGGPHNLTLLNHPRDMTCPLAQSHPFKALNHTSLSLSLSLSFLCN